MTTGKDRMAALEAWAMEIACRAVEQYGEGDEREAQAARLGNLWKDHPAYQAALAALSTPPTVGQEVPWHGERPEAVCTSIAQFWSQWEEDRAGKGVYLAEELAEDAGHFANDLFDHLAALSSAQPAVEQVPVGEVVLFGGDLKEVAWRKGKLPPVGTKLYTTPPAPVSDDSEAVHG